MRALNLPNRCHTVAILLGCTFSFLWASPSALSQSRTELSSTALTLAPQDAAFFATSVNMGDAWRNFVNGAFVARLRSVRYVQTLEREIVQQWDVPQGPLGQLRGYLENPNVQNVLRLLSDMCSDESFVYAENDWCEAIEATVKYRNEFLELYRDDLEGIDRFFAELDRASIDRIPIPTLVMGFRLTEVENARLQLDALEGIFRLAGQADQEWQTVLNNLQRKDYSDGQSLSLVLDTSLIPLDSVPEENRAQVDKVIELLEGRSISLSIGIKSSILVIALSESPDVIESIGEVSPSLLDHEAMAPLKQADLAELRSINYLSSRWRQSQWNANFGHYFRNLTAQFSGAITNSQDEIEDAEEWKAEIAEDARLVDERINEIAPRFGDMVAWSRATKSGEEGWTYDWSTNMGFEDGAPLEVLDYAGTHSLLLMGFKQIKAPAASALFDLFLDKAPRHIERFIVAAEEDEQDRQLALDVYHRVWPMLDEVVEIFRQKIFPSLHSNETLFSFAANWTTQRLGELPLAEEPLPLPEFAMACKLDDRELFLEGCDNLYGVFDQVLELVRELNPEGVPPDYSVPRPQEAVAGETTTYYYDELSKAIPLEGFRLQLMVSNEAIVIGYSDRQVRDMIAKQRLRTRPAWMTDETPVAVVSYADFGGILGAIRPWIKYGLLRTQLPLDQPIPIPPSPFSMPCGNDLLQIWDCFGAAGKFAGTMQIGDGPAIGRWVWVSQ